MSDDDDWGPGGASSSSESDAASDFDESDDDGGSKKKKKGGGRGGRGGARGGKGGGGRKKKEDGGGTKRAPAKRKAPASKKGKDDEGGKRGGKKAKGGGGGGAEKKKPTPEKEAPTILCEYLKKENRPFNVQQVFDNLQAHHQFKKPVIQRTLEALTEKGEIQSKEFGKSVSFFYNQSKLAEVSLDLLGELDEKIDTLSNELITIRQENRQIDAENKEIEKRATIKEIDDSITKTATKVKQKTEKIKKLKSGAIKLVDKAEADQVRADFLKEFQSMKKVRKFGMERLNDLIGESEVKLEEFAASMRIDTDDSAAFEFQKWRDIAEKAEQLSKQK